MLSERLKEKSLFNDEQEAIEAQKKAARRFINGAVRDLVAAMRCVELDEVMTRDEIENFVLNRMEYYEVNVYSKDKEEFDAWLDDQFRKSIKASLADILKSTEELI